MDCVDLKESLRMNGLFRAILPVFPFLWSTTYPFLDMLVFLIQMGELLPWHHQKRRYLFQFSFILLNTPCFGRVHVNVPRYHRRKPGGRHLCPVAQTHLLVPPVYLPPFLSLFFCALRNSESNRSGPPVEVRVPSFCSNPFR